MLPVEPARQDKSTGELGRLFLGDFAFDHGRRGAGVDRFLCDNHLGDQLG